MTELRRSMGKEDPLFEEIAIMKVQDLNEELKQFNLSQEGKKHEKVKRLYEYKSKRKII